MVYENIHFWIMVGITKKMSYMPTNLKTNYTACNNLQDPELSARGCNLLTRSGESRFAALLVNFSSNLFTFSNMSLKQLKENKLHLPFFFLFHMFITFKNYYQFEINLAN